MFHHRTYQAYTPVPTVAISTMQRQTTISVYGLSRSGIKLTASLASLGYRVIGVDCDPDKIDALNNGQSDLGESGLNEMLKEGLEKGLIRFSDDILLAVHDSDMTLISQGYGVDVFGQSDPYPLMAMGRTLGAALKWKGAGHVVMLNAPAAPELFDEALIPALSLGIGRHVDHDHLVCEMPADLRDDLAMPEYCRVLETFMSRPEAAIFATR